MVVDERYIGCVGCTWNSIKNKHNVQPCASCFEDKPDKEGGYTYPNYKPLWETDDADRDR